MGDGAGAGFDSHVIGARTTVAGFCIVTGMTIFGLQRDTEGYGFFSDPWRQAALTGALTLIPARQYPRWLQRTLIRGFPVATAIGFGYLAAKPEALDKLGERFGGERESTGIDDDAGQRAEGEPNSDGGAPPLAPAKRAILIAAAGAAIGIVSATLTAAALWADEKTDRGLRKLNVPLPRVVMGCAAAAVTWWQVTAENKRKEQQAVESQRTGTDPASGTVTQWPGLRLNGSR